MFFWVVDIFYSVLWRVVTLPVWRCSSVLSLLDTSWGLWTRLTRPYVFQVGSRTFQAITQKNSRMFGLFAPVILPLGPSFAVMIQFRGIFDLSTPEHVFR